MTVEHVAVVRRIGPGVFRAECSCGDWIGPLQERSRYGDSWIRARHAALVNARAHDRRDVAESTKGATSVRPVRISDDLWSGVLAATSESVTASDVVRAAIAAYPPVADALAGQ